MIKFSYKNSSIIINKLASFVIVKYLLYDAVQ